MNFVPRFNYSELDFRFWLWKTSDFEFALITSVVFVIACLAHLDLLRQLYYVGTGLAAKHGILIKDSETLEKAHFNYSLRQTGTLTEATVENIVANL